MPEDFFDIWMYVFSENLLQLFRSLRGDMTEVAIACGEAEVLVGQELIEQVRELLSCFKQEKSLLRIR